VRGDVEYLRITPGEPLPDISAYRPFKAIVVIEADHSADWESAVSRWLVDSGCLYMMAWGRGCSSWHDSVDWANLEDFGYGEIPADRFVMTTWHEREPLEEVFWFADHCATAYDDEIRLGHTLIIDISVQSRREEMLRHFATAIVSDFDESDDAD
jgi:hypothetical protein